MLLTITTHHQPATDLGYLLHKNPARLQSFELSFGHAHVFYPEATNERCTAALLLDVDPVGLVRNRRGPAGEGGSLDRYVNDRPYVASSFLSVAIAQVFASALGGRSKGRQELAETPIPLMAKISVLQCRGGEELIKKLFEPLGYQLLIQQHVLDEKFPWTIVNSKRFSAWMSLSEVGKSPATACAWIACRLRKLLPCCRRPTRSEAGILIMENTKEKEMVMICELLHFIGTFAFES